MDGIPLSVFEQYGPIGILAFVILVLYLKQTKRMEKLENDKQENYDKQIRVMTENHAAQMEAYKELIKEYVQLVENNTTVIGKLTSCVESFKSTLAEVKDRIKT